jgi:hypothetical protein
MSNIFLVVVAACLAVAVIQQFFKHSRSSQRRIYWSCTCVAAVAGFLAAHPDSKKGLGMALFLLGAMTVVAYAYTPYIKIGGKIYALTVQDSQSDSVETPAGTPMDVTADLQHDPAPNAYSGLLSATKMWWLLIPLLVISSGNVFAFATGEGEGWVAAVGLGFLVFLAIATGYGDASWDYPIARRQRIQFGIITVITVGIFTALYLLAYFAGKHRPLRRTQSMEYRAHPRHRRLG